MIMVAVEDLGLWFGSLVTHGVEGKASKIKIQRHPPSLPYSGNVVEVAR